MESALLCKLPSGTRHQVAHKFVPNRHKEHGCILPRGFDRRRHEKPFKPTNSAIASPNGQGRAHLRAKAASLILLLPAALGLLRVTSGLLAAVELGCNEGVDTIVTLCTKFFGDNGDAFSLTPSDIAVSEDFSELAASLSGSGSLTEDAISDEGLRGLRGSEQGNLQGTLREMLILQLKLMEGLFPRMLGITAAIMLSEMLHMLATVLNPIHIALLVAEFHVHVGMGAALLRGLVFLLPALVLPLRLPWLRSLLLKTHHEVSMSRWGRMWLQRESPRQQEVQSLAGLSGHAATDGQEAAMSRGLGSLPGFSAEHSAMPFRRGQGLSLDVLQTTRSSTGLERTVVQMTDVCTSLQNESISAPSGFSHVAEGVLRQPAAPVSSITSGPSNMSDDEWRHTNGLVTDTAASMLALHMDNRLVHGGKRSWRPESARLAVNVMRLASLLGTSIAACFLPITLQQSWPLMLIDMATAGASAVLAVAACIEVWRQGDDGYLFKNGGERAIKLASALLWTRGGVELAHAFVPEFSSTWYNVNLSQWACIIAWSCSVSQTTEPLQMYSQLLNIVMALVHTYAYITTVL